MDTLDVDGPIAGVVGPEPHAGRGLATASRTMRKAFEGLTDGTLRERGPGGTGPDHSSHVTCSTRIAGGSGCTNVPSGRGGFHVSVEVVKRTSASG